MSRDARRTCDSGVVIGYVDREDARAAHLNPPEGYVLQRGDRIVVLTDNSTVTFVKKNPDESCDAQVWRGWP